LPTFPALDTERVFHYHPDRFERAGAIWSSYYFLVIMGNPNPPKPAKLVASVLCSDKQVRAKTLEALALHWQALDFISEIMPFDFTDYYKEEMGGGLGRTFVGFEYLIDPEHIVAIKQCTNEIEASLSPEPGRRTVNIDPGYLTAQHLILATTKPAPHRPYLRQGIYADLALVYQEHCFRALPWTYPDYRSDKMIALMNVLRQKYLFQVQEKAERFRRPKKGAA
jgi:hypothetical protein